MDKFPQTGDPKRSGVKTRTGRWLISLLGLYFVLAAVPLLAKTFGVHFLPSTAWLEKCRAAAVVLGASTAIVGTYAAAKGLAMKGEPLLGLKSIAILLFGGFMFFEMGFQFVIVGIPMSAAMIRSDHVELRYTVEKASGFSDRRCRNKIVLADMPFMFDELCGFTTELRSHLAPGMSIGVVGLGTGGGVFPERIRILE